MDERTKHTSTESPRSMALAYGRHGPRRFRLDLADRFWLRFAGLMLRRPPPDEQGLLLMGCASIHTLFMRYRLDIAWLDAAGRVLACVADLGPWRARLGPRGTAHVLELRVGSLEALGIEVGSRIEHPALQGRSAA
ncbi:DUF192 domain-containing protein [Pseudothauera nasutitermitis]|uniref:DUF192 domain-containing protein n=1 Tax=Pseudothauera nasutitermitis TaxID=2565930 RepID=A0A4S4AWY7_9RHOO|nr:DUF192 domain-containing protein [Pseudothauera nasutitermitis]THF64573.1 DUF192 domain-containing protein [Pseudothauera nasutitermitis]